MIPITSSPAVSSSSVATVRGAIDKVPPAVASLLARAGLTIAIVPALKGGGEGLTEFGRGVLRITLADDAYGLLPTTLHEIGHALDFALGEPSSSPEFRQVYSDACRQFAVSLTAMARKDCHEMFAECAKDLWLGAAKRWLPPCEHILNLLTRLSPPTKGTSMNRKASSAPRRSATRAVQASGLLQKRVAPAPAPTRSVVPARPPAQPMVALDGTLSAEALRQIDLDAELSHLPAYHEPEPLPDAQREWRRCARRLARTNL